MCQLSNEDLHCQRGWRLRMYFRQLWREWGRSLHCGIEGKEEGFWSSLLPCPPFLCWKSSWLLYPAFSPCNCCFSGFWLCFAPLEGHSKSSVLCKEACSCSLSDLGDITWVWWQWQWLLQGVWRAELTLCFLVHVLKPGYWARLWFANLLRCSHCSCSLLESAPQSMQQCWRRMLGWYK